MTNDPDLRARLVDLWTDPSTDPGARQDFLAHAADPALERDARALEQLWSELGAALQGPGTDDVQRARLRTAVLRAMPARSLRLLRAAALVAVSFGLGWLARSVPAGSADTRPEYLMMIRGDVPAEAEPVVAGEMAAWAGALADGGHLVDARRLDEGTARWIGTDPGPSARGPAVGGYFLVRAADDAEAARLATAAPHLRYGGDTAVELVPLVPPSRP